MKSKQEEEVSITITQTYYKKLLQNAWVVERLKKHIQNNYGDTQFRRKAETLLIGSLKDSLDIKDFGKEQDG